MIPKKKSPVAESEQGKSQTSESIIDDGNTKIKGQNKQKYWVGVLYPENMVDDWETQIGDLVQVPYEYGYHTVDTDTQSEHRKDHIHLILVWPNPTTYDHAMAVFNRLSAPGKKSLNRIEGVVNIRHMHNYLIHDTETCRKLGKYLYPPEARKSGNNFDIGAYEQLGLAEKNDMCKELCKVIISNGFTNFTDFFMYVLSNYEDANYFEILKSNSGLFERLTKGNFQKWQWQQQSGQVRSVPLEVDLSTGEITDDL